MPRFTLLFCLCALMANRVSADDRPDKNWLVVQAATQKTIRFDGLVKLLAENDVVFVGEQHDDPETHVAERILLESLSSRMGTRLTLGMEMFERDGQAALTDYLAGKTDESTLGKSLKFWPNYATDYRPLIEYAKANKIPVLGTNAPARIVRTVGKEGFTAISTLADSDKKWISPFVMAPDGDLYQIRFAGVISEGHGDGQKMEFAMVRHFYEAQCLRDDTMADSIAQAVQKGNVVLHVNGSFHSDAGLGTAARTRWRLRPTQKIAIVKIVAVAGNVKKADSAALIGEADYLIFVTKRQK